MTKIVDQNGRTVTADDPKRAIWYAAMCGYWTDDWSKLRLVGPGIPCCPECGCPGCIIDADEWFDGAEEFEKDKEDNKGYVAFLNENKEKCLKKVGGFLKAFRRRHDNMTCKCERCGKTGFVQDEFTSPYTGLCADCSKQKENKK